MEWIKAEGGIIRLNEEWNFDFRFFGGEDFALYALVKLDSGQRVTIRSPRTHIEQLAVGDRIRFTYARGKKMKVVKDLEWVS